MKKLFRFISILILGFGLIGCDFKINNGRPIGIGDEIPTAVIIKSEKNISKITAGDSLQLAATVFPETAPQTVKWSSNNLDVATVDDNGLVTGVTAGTVTIRAAAAAKEEVVGSYYLTVIARPINPTAVKIVGPVALFVNEEVKFSYEVTPADATATPIWTSSDNAIFSVDNNGRVTAHTPGDAELVLTIGGIVDRLPITVKTRITEPESLTIIGRNEVEIGHTVPLRLVVTPQSAKNDVVWSSSDTNVAAVDVQGTVTAHNTGTVTITATSSINAELVATIEITVVCYTIDDTNLQTQVIDVIAKTKDSILGVTNYKYDNNNSKFVKHSLGSGAVYDVWFKLKDGSVIYNLDEITTFSEVDKYCYYLMTNKHVVKDADKVKVYLHEEEYEVDAVVRQYDNKVDLAVIYFEHTRYIRPLQLGDSGDLLSGQFVVAIGNPSGYDFSSSATFGIVSHPKRYLAEDTDDDGTNDWDGEYIQHDVAINPGNSGGPLLNLNGEIIGMNTLKFASTDIDNMGFSIPSDVIMAIIPLLEQGEKPERAALGVTVQEVKAILEYPKPEDPPIPEEIRFGLYVVAVGEGSVAASGGIITGDIILTFNGVPITKTLLLRFELNKVMVGVGQTVEAEVYRNGEIITIVLEF